MSLHPEIECLSPSNNGDLLQVDGDDLGYQGRATSSRSQKEVIINDINVTSYLILLLFKYIFIPINFFFCNHLAINLPPSSSMMNILTVVGERSKDTLDNDDNVNVISKYPVIYILSSPTIVMG